MKDILSALVQVVLSETPQPDRTNFVRMSFDVRLREIMGARGVDQTQLAAGLGVTSQAVTQWANAKTQPRGARLAKIASFLQVSPSDLLAPVGAPFGGNEVAAPKVDPEHGRNGADLSSKALLMRLWGEISPEMQNALLAMAMALARAEARAKITDLDDVSGGHT